MLLITDSGVISPSIDTHIPLLPPLSGPQTHTTIVLFRARRRLPQWPPAIGQTPPRLLPRITSLLIGRQCGSFGGAGRDWPDGVDGETCEPIEEGELADHTLLSGDVTAVLSADGCWSVNSLIGQEDGGGRSLL